MIRKEVGLVFDAFINPEVSKHFWFTKSSGKLVEGQQVTWHWHMYGIEIVVLATKIIENEQITLEWGEPSTIVKIEFEELSQQQTLVKITESGFDLEGEELLAKIKDSTGGFTTVLDGMKGYLEHGISLQLIADKYPKKHR